MAVIGSRSRAVANGGKSRDLDLSEGSMDSAEWKLNCSIVAAGDEQLGVLQQSRKGGERACKGAGLRGQVKHLNEKA
eukprot:1157803-Pelagomonas_calceolata.AAC.7